MNDRKSKKFNAAIPFSPFLPYDNFFAERVPLVQALTLAIAECHRRGTGAGQRYFAAECGVYTGSSLLACHQLAESYGVNLHFLGFDTFTGLPDLNEQDQAMAPKDAPYLTKKLFKDTSKRAVTQLLKENGYSERTKLFSGLFANSLPKVGEREYIFVNIDCDLYEGHMQCLEHFYPRLLAGGILFFDDYYSKHFPAARLAIDEFMSDKPEQLFKLTYGKLKVNHTKCFIVKF